MGQLDIECSKDTKVTQEELTAKLVTTKRDVKEGETFEELTAEDVTTKLEGCLPVLDMKIWMKDDKIVHTFYKKQVASPFTIMKQSAISNTIKKSTLFQEGLRRISHILSSLGWDDTVRHMIEYSYCMKIS